MKNLRPLFLFVALLLVVGMACSVLSGGGGNQPSQPTQSPQEVATQPPPPPTQKVETEAPPTVEEPTSTPEPVIQKFFTEEFDQDPGPDWSIDILGPGADANKDSIKTEFSNGRMRIEIPRNDLYFYYTFNGFSYDNVRVDLLADNRGVNSNNVSLVCRASKDGWYEWSVGSDGLWYLYAVTNKYNLITNGGTTFLKQGKAENEYAMVCNDKTISMFVNGSEVKLSPVTDNKYGLREGVVGFNISSLKVTPVIVEVESFKISEP